uniref:Tcc44h21-2.2 n=1 Tax=Trypanosoma cruzi TaxID=5693 RepID=Q8T1Q7_TRYCR|nr:Tcc44h21-2.2 [Trypanosoma cruzi]
MLRRTIVPLAKVYGAAPPNGTGQKQPVRHRLLHGKRERQGSLFAIANDVKYDEKRLRQQLNAMLEEERLPPRTRLEHNKANGGEALRSVGLSTCRVWSDAVTCPPIRSQGCSFSTKGIMHCTTAHMTTPVYRTKIAYK